MMKKMGNVFPEFLQKAEQAAINYGKQIKVDLWWKALKSTIEKSLRPKRETVMGTGEVQP